MGDSDTVIRVHGVSKRYVIRHRGLDTLTLRDTLAQGVKAVTRRLRGRAGPRAETQEEFWALRDVSFDVKQGEVVGLIGRNGAGKSTLLKVLSKITEPTTGRIEIDGRVASLLEVGTGFHPELTGRENIFLNGAILGMSRAEIKRKFEEIVAFAEIEKFLDTPVRRYSSGMYMRLAFAIAAHLDPEILIVDEVLAVGDAEFQKKCLGKMGQVARQGRTVLVVSHQLATITNLCSKAMLLHEGQLTAVGVPQEIMKKYLKPRATREARSVIQRPPWAEPLIQRVGTIGPHGEDQEVFLLGSDIAFEMAISLPPDRKISSPFMGIYINHMLFGVVGAVDTRMTGYYPSSTCCRQFMMRGKLLAPPLLQGSYTADLWFGDGQQELDVAKECVNFRIVEADVYGTGRVPDDSIGTVFFKSEWETLELPVPE